MPKGKRWSENVGPHGASVTVEERKRGGNVQLLVWDPIKRYRRPKSLGFKVRDTEGKLIDAAVKKAKAEAAKASNRLIEGELPQESEEHVVTVSELFRRFRRDVVAEFEGKYAAETKRACAMWERLLGSGFPVAMIGESELRRFVRQRESGRIDANGRRIPKKKRREVGARAVAKDIKVLRQACLYGTRKRTSPSTLLLPFDPTAGFELPKNPTPNRPIADDAYCSAILEKAREVMTGWGKRRMRSALYELCVLAPYTAGRRGALVALKWSDWLPDQGPYGSLRFRNDTDKRDMWRVVEVHPAVREALEGWRVETGGMGDAWMFPSPKEKRKHIDPGTANRWLRRAEKLAGIEHQKGFGFHAFRRAWATKRKHLPAKDVAAVGGWKNTQTLERIYQHTDADTQREVVMADRPLKVVRSA